MPRLTERERNIERRKKKKEAQKKANAEQQKPKATNPKQAPANRRANAARSQRQTHKVFDRGETTERKQTYNNRANQQSHKQYQYATPRRNPPSGRGGTRGHESYEAREPRAQNGSRILANTGRAIEKGLKDRVSGWAITAQDKTEEIAEKSKENPNVRGLQTQARRLGRDFDADSKVKELQEKHKAAELEAEQSRKELQAKRDERQKKFEEQTKDASGFEKALYGAAESGAGMLADLAVGAAVGAATGGAGTVGTLASLGVGSYGQTRGTAEAQGATEDEDRMNALLQAGKEVATESIFRGVGLASGYAGRGSISLADRAANKLTSKLTGKAADLVGAGVRLGGGVAEENAEEFLGWLADPLISEATYEGNVRKRRQEQIRSQMKEESDALRAQVRDEQTARSIATYLSSDDFIERNKQEYIAAGLPEKRATAMAEQMRDYLTASLSGDTEEMERLEKEMATSITGKGLSSKSWSFKELGETIASTTLLTASTGLPGTIQSSVKGAQVKEQLGEDGIKAIAKTAIDFEDKEMSEKAQVMSDRIEQGKGITDTQAYDLMQGMMKQQEKDAKRMDASRNSAQQRIEDEELVSPYEEYEDGSLSLGPVTGQAIRANTKSAKSVIQSVNKENKDNSKYHISAKEVNESASAIAAFQSGIMTIDDANAFNYNNQVVRKAFEETTGIDLDQYIVKKKDGSIDIPATNTKTKDALFVLASDNLVASAQAETAEWMDNTKGEVVTNISARMGANGTVALQEALDDVDERNQSDYMLVANASDLLYQSARNMGAEWDSVKSDVTKMFPEIPESKLESMYLAGLNDRLAAEDTVRNRAVKIGESMSEMGDQETATGQLFVDSKLPLKGTEIRLFSELANNLGADIHLVDHIKTNAGEANGAFNPKTNTFYINVANGAESNLGYIMMHEMTHYLKVNAPEQFLALENLVREKWFGYSPEQMQSEIARKVSLYKGEQALTEEMALEEIIADAAHEFINDPNFAKQVAEEDPTLAKALIDSIKKILRMLRRLFTVEGIERDDTHMNSLFSQLDILTEAEALWLDAYKTAVRNRGNQAIEELQDEIDGNIASEMEDRFSIVEDPELIKQLEADSHMKTYRAMAQINGKLYPPMATQIRDENGEWKLNDGIELGQWVESDITTDPKMFNAKGQFILKKDNGKTVPAAYNPYIHSSDSMLNDQFSTAYKRPNVVVVEGEIPESELTSGYRAEHDLDDGRHVIAKDSTGSAKWKAGIVEKDLPKDRQRTVYLTNHFKPTRIVPDNEVADHIRNKLEGTDIVVPYNVVSPGVRKELQNLGVTMAQSKQSGYYVDLGNDQSEFVTLSPQRIDNLIDKYAIPGNTESDYSKAWIATINPRDFLKLTISDDALDRWEVGTTNEWGQEVRELDKEDLVAKGKYVPYMPFLRINTSESHSVISHEGRHRMLALYRAGYTEVPVVIVDNNEETKYNKHPMEDGEGTDLWSQDFGDGAVNDDASIEVYDTIPINEKNRAEIERVYGSTSEDQVRFSLNEAGVDLTEGGTAVKYSLSSWNDTDKKSLIRRLVQAGFEKDVAQKWVDDINSIAAIIALDRTRLDYIADRFQKALKDNDEYYKTLDLSTLCAKRRLYQGTYNAIMHRLKDRGLQPEDTVRLRQMMDQMGYETPCGICYEESRKKNEGKFAERWLYGDGDKWAGYKNMEHDDPYIPTLDEVTTTDGRAKLREEHPDALEAYLSYQRTRGSANPKVSFTHTDYREDIKNLTNNTIEKIKHIGGLRIQSFSDFEVVHVIDMMQAIMDMSAKNLTAQAYTKVPAFADIFGGTGIKINLSLIGQVKDGKLWFDSKEGINPDEAFRIREKYPDNVGTIIVGANEESILAAWADPRIDMVIPFHRSGWAEKEFEALGLGDYDDFQAYQSERYLDGSPNGIGLKDAKMDAIYSEDYWDYSKTGKENAEAYLKLCAEKHYRPVFYNFLHDNGDGTWSLQEDGSTDGYWKSLIDYKMYDNNGKGVPQVEVQPVFDMDVAADVMAKYEGNADTLPVAEDVVDKFVDELAESNRYSLSDTEQRDRDYMAAVNSGNMDEAQRLVDEAAKAAGMRPMHMYHGTMNAGFTVFDKSYAKVGGNSGAGFYFSTNMDDSADHYQDVEGADNYFKWSELAEAIWDTGELPNGEDVSDQINSYEEAVKFAKDYLNKSPGTFDVYLNYKNPYIRDYRKSTDLYDHIMSEFDPEEYIDRSDYDSDEDYEDDLMNYRDEYFFDRMREAVYSAFNQIEGFYDYVDGIDVGFLADEIASNYDYDLNWDRIEKTILNAGEVYLSRDEWIDSGDGTRELTRAIIEELGFDAIVDKEVSSKFGQLSREMQTDTEHVIVFKPEQIKLSDPVTYAEDGSVIPLSDRFDPNNNDIRYSLPTQDSDGNVLTDGQMEYFKDSQARDEDGKLAVVYHTTNHGGFTVFDPHYSDDKRSLFFASNFDVSQTYGSNASSKIYPDGFNISTLEDVQKYFDEYSPDRFLISKDAFERAGGYEADLVDFANEGAETFSIEKYQKDVASGKIAPEDYYIVVGLPNYTGEGDYDSRWEITDNLESLPNVIRDDFNWQSFNYRNTPGYYECYLNLKNPLIVDGKGAFWSEIPYALNKGEHVKAVYQNVNIVVEPIWDDESQIIGRTVYGSFDKNGKHHDIAQKDIMNPNDPNTDEYWDKLDEWEEDAYHIAFGHLAMAEVPKNMIKAVFDPDNEDPMDGSLVLNGEFDKEGMRIEEDGDSELDFYSTRELAEIADVNGYDGVIIRNIRDIGIASSLKGSSYSDIFIAFDSAQVKDTQNENPTDDPDIRFSVTPEDDALEWLASQYELDDIPLEDEVAEEGRVRMMKSKENFIQGKINEWNPRWLTEGKVLKESSVKGNIKQLVMSVMENSDTDRQYKTELVDKLVIDARSAYWMMKDGREGEAAELLWQSARDMIEDVDFIDDSAFQTYKKLRDYLKDTQFKIGEEYWQDVDYRDFRRRNLNRIKLVKGDTNIDSLYKELQEQWPEWFDEKEQLSVPDQLLHIEEVLNGIQPYKYAYTSEEAAGLATDIADDLYSIVYEGKEYKSVADTYKERYDKKTKALKARHEEALRKVKEKGDLRVRREKAKFQAYKEKKKNAKEKAKHFGSIQKNLDWLTTRLVNETKDKNIPEPFRRSLAHLLMQFDMQTERSKKLEEKYGVSKKQLQIRELKRRLEDISKEDGTGEFEYSGYLFYLMDALAEKVEGESIDALDTEDLIAVDTLLKSLRHNFSNYDKVWKEGKQVEIAELGDNTIKTMQTHIDKYGQRKSHTGVIGLTDKLLNEGEETPVYLFGRIDPDGTGIGAMYKEMRRGEDKHIRNMDFLRKRFADMFGEYFNKKKPGSELENWRNSAQEQTFNLENGSITLNPAQIMSLYCLSKRPQALGHILGSGIVASPVNTQQKLREAVKGRAEQVESVRVTYDEVQKIISSLTPEQIKLADEMQSLMNNEMAAWGNEASLRLHGIKLFREKNYFPIKSSGEALDKTADSFDNAEKIKNFGFTKPLVRNANNAIMLDDIFSVVADHCNKMSLYNAMAVPITDFMRVYNYKQRREDGTVESTVQSKLGEAYTRKVNQYIMKFISDVNGSTQTRSDAVDDLMNKALANYKKASIGFNMRVALQQPTAIFRAFMVISPNYFKNPPSPSAIKEMQEHCPIALWKSWGHYDMDLGRDIEDVMMNNDWSKFDVATMGLYGALDNATWSMIWQACKNEVEDKHPDVEVGSEEYWELCNERASEVFDKTQVVDSIFHRSDVMRSKNTLTKMAVSFMAEPTLTYNCLRNSMVNAYEMWKDGNKREALSQVEKTFVVLALNAAAVSASAAIWDAIRGKGADGDDDKDFAQLWFMNFFENLKDNANMLNNIYFVSNIMDIAQGWGTQNMALEGFATFFKGLEQAKKKYQGAYQAWQEPSWYDVYMNIFGGVGYVTGVPVKTAMRDARAIMNKLGLKVFADDGSIKGEEEINSWLDTLRESLPSIPDIKLPSLPFGKKDEEEEELPLTPKEYRATLEDGLTESQKNEYIRQYRQYLKSIGWDDESLEKAKEKAGEKTSKTDTKSNDKEEEKDPYQVMDERAAKKSEGLSGEELDDALWSSIGEGYTKHLQDADFAHINKIRSIYEKYGGDVEKFDKKILEQCPTAYKKTFVDDMTEEDIHKQELLKDYMLEHGVTMEQLSDICYRTYAARDLKAALRMGNEQYILDELVPLVRAGLSRDDFYKLYKYRNYGADSYDGKYSGDEYKASTGTYVWPTQGQITSYFGYRNAPTAGASSNHPAIDIGASQGSPVVAADGGTVISAGSAGGYGNQVAIRHDNGIVTYYSHLYGWNVKVGDTVAQGQQIGQVGSTGVSTGPHLDFKVEVNGEPVNPLDYLS